MKFIFAIAFLFVHLAQGSPTNLVSLQYISGTSNAGVYYASNIYIPRQKFLFQSLGITNGGSTATQRLTVNIQVSIDPSNTNWVTLHTWNPTTTNATVESFGDDLDRIALPIRAQVITTNAIGAAVFKQ